MVSLQSESNPWFHYDFDMPPEEEYVSAFDRTLRPSYDDDLELIPPNQGDPLVEETLQTLVKNAFVEAYVSSPLRCSSNQSYTLFVPIQSPEMDKSLELMMTPGKSFEDRQNRVQGKAWQEKLLLRHMCPYRILPEELQGQDVHITTKWGEFDINAYGWITPDIQIVKYVLMPHASLYFITSEIVYDMD